MEQQCQELPLCQSQQEQARQSQQQSRFSGCLFAAEYSSSPELANGNWLSVPEESSLAPAIGVTRSENQTEPDGLVGSPNTRPVHPR